MKIKYKPSTSQRKEEKKVLPEPISTLVVEEVPAEEVKKPNRKKAKRIAEEEN